MIDPYKDMACDVARRALDRVISGDTVKRIDSIKARLMNRARGLLWHAIHAIDSERSDPDLLGLSFIDLGGDVCALDTETTGFDPVVDSITEIAVIRCDRHLREIAREHVYVIPYGDFRPDQFVYEETRFGVEADCNPERWQASGAVCLFEALATVDPLLSGARLCAHNAPFDLAFLREAYKIAGPEIATTGHALSSESRGRAIETLQLCLPARARGELESRQLAGVARALGITHRPHCALSDASACLELARILILGEL